MRGEVKAQAWRTAAAHLEAIARDKRSEDFASDDREVWAHIEAAVIPSIDNRARIIERRLKPSPKTPRARATLPSGGGSPPTPTKPPTRRKPASKGRP